MVKRGANELHIVAIRGETPRFWLFPIPSARLQRTAEYLGYGKLALILDLDETLFQARGTHSNGLRNSLKNTMTSASQQERCRAREAAALALAHRISLIARGVHAPAGSFDTFRFRFSALLRRR